MDVDRLTEIYGNSIVEFINDNMDTITSNIKYLESRGYTEVADLLVLYPYSFGQEEDIFKEKVDKLIDTLGVDYVEKIKNNFELWGDVDV